MAGRAVCEIREGTVVSGNLDSGRVSGPWLPSHRITLCPWDVCAATASHPEQPETHQGLGEQFHSGTLISTVKANLTIMTKRTQSSAWGPHCGHLKSSLNSILASRHCLH